MPRTPVPQWAFGQNARALVEWLAVGVVGAVAVLVLSLTGAGSRTDHLIYDQFLRWGGRTPSDRIVIVAIDDPSLQALGAWPWPRARHAELIDQLTKQGAAAIAYDVMFLEPDPTGGDPALATAIKASGRTVLPELFVAPGDNGRGVKIERPLPALADAARAIGHVSLNLDSDGVIRRVSSAVAVGGACWPHLTLALAAVAGIDVAQPDCAALVQASKSIDGLVATPPALIAFAGRAGRVVTASAIDVLRGEVPDAVFRGRMVLVGATASGLGDRHLTAVSGRNGAMAGVEIQANLLDAAIQHKVIRALSPWVRTLGSLLPLLLFLAALLILRPATNMVVGGGLIAAVFVMSFALFKAGVWAPPMPAAVGLLVVYPLWSWRRLAVASDALRDEIARFPTGPFVATGSPTDTLGRQVGELRRAADLLRNSNRQLADALQSLPDATVVTDGLGVIRLANLQAERIGSEALHDGLTGTPLTEWLTRVFGPVEAQTVLSALEAGEMAVQIVSRTGVDYEVARAAIATPQGEGAIVRLADVTAVRLAGRQREEVMQLLSHDLRAPIASIVTLLEGSPASNSKALRTRITAYARRGLALAEGYVQLARAETYRFHAEPFLIGQAMLDAMDELWPQAQAKTIALIAEGLEAETLIDGDRSLITRALINLLDNAIKYSPAATTVTVSLREADGMARCAIADEGPGMTAAAAEGLFERFNRGDGWRSGASGAGLGLAMVHTVAKRHGGGVTCVSTPGDGAVFVLSFPVLAEPDAGAHSSTAH